MDRVFSLYEILTVVLFGELKSCPKRIPAEENCLGRKMMLR